MQKIVLVLFYLLGLAWLDQAAARPGIFGGPDVTPIVQSEEATRKEIERIQKLAPSKSPALNQESLGEARSSIDAYSGYSEHIAALEKISIEATKNRVTEAAGRLALAIKGCQRKSIAENLLIIRRQLGQFQGLGFDGFPLMVSLPESEEATVSEVTQFLQLDPEKLCNQYPDKQSMEAMRLQLDTAMAIASKQLTSNISAFKEQAPRAKRLSEAWEKYRDLLLKSIEDQSAPATKVADQLGLIIGVFCAFGILMFLSVRVFSPDVQVELIASGQVIQFATVMVLLIVVCVLGMSKFLTENTLGTLLGGIGGYVLSQGVGRAVSRAATRDSQSRQQQSGTNG
ncbi:hypothetical protein ACO9S2_11955 [Nitrospira sp. NS4]|uniref:hypothetical protein n=1 Tax=Nitrospira sp. NS4 TaxID=3414498 RepID=UPI003C2D771F